jgi:hypothetical protein
MHHTNTEREVIHNENSVAKETSSEENEIEKSGNEDPDEAVHLEQQVISEENKEQDPDDAVHKTVTPTIVSEDIDKQIDADDAVHGN